MNLERRINQARGRGLNIDNIAILCGTEKWEKRESSEKTDRYIRLHLRWLNDRGKLSSGDSSSCPEFFMAGFMVRWLRDTVICLTHVPLSVAFH